VSDAPSTTDRPGTTLDDVLGAALDRLTRAGLRRTLGCVERRRPGTVAIDGREVVDFASNDYLGLAADERLREAVRHALDDSALGAASARLIAGNHPLHAALERDLAAFKGTEAALLFASGYAANIGTIPALIGRRDAVYGDALNHASLIDGCRLSGAEFRTFPHCDVDALAALLDADRGRYRRQLIVVDGVFSMDGDLAPLDRLVPLARAANAWLYVDDAHATGVLGAHGRGCAEHWGGRVEGEIDVVMGTLGKALGTMGAFVCGSRTLIDYLTNRARAFVFTTGTPPALAAAAATAVQIAHTEDWRRTRLRSNARRLRDGLRSLGLVVPGPDDGHIVPIVVGDAERAVRLGAALRARGFLVGAVRPPTVPLGGSRLRLSLSAAHMEAQIDGVVGALSETLPA
jgi:8-amino-7-oxononanoate synthase